MEILIPTGTDHELPGRFLSIQGDVVLDEIGALQAIAPDMCELIERRYRILRTVVFTGPVGRRVLAYRLQLPERTIRRDIELLGQWGLLVGTKQGMQITEAGQEILDKLKAFIRQLHGLASLEQSLTDQVGSTRFVVVPGDADKDPEVTKDMAKATTRFLKKVLRNGDILAVTGGTTLSHVADSFAPDGVVRDITVVAARGGLGEDVNIQANSIAARVARGLGCRYRLLHAPEHVDPELVETIVNEPRIRDVIATVRRSRVLLHGVGTAEEMARRRGLDEEHLMALIADGAVGEAFGYYFDPDGRIVYATSSVGLRLEDLPKIPLKIGVSGGRRKAWALLAVVLAGFCDVCITDEGAARRLMDLLKKKEERQDGN